MKRVLLHLLLLAATATLLSAVLWRYTLEAAAAAHPHVVEVLGRAESWHVCRGVTAERRMCQLENVCWEAGKGELEYYVGMESRVLWVDARTGLRRDFGDALVVSGRDTMTRIPARWAPRAVARERTRVPGVREDLALVAVLLEPRGECGSEANVFLNLIVPAARLLAYFGVPPSPSSDVRLLLLDRPGSAHVSKGSCWAKVMDALAPALGHRSWDILSTTASTGSSVCYASVLAGVGGLGTLNPPPEEYLGMSSAEPVPFRDRTLAEVRKAILQLYEKDLLAAETISRTEVLLLGMATSLVDEDARNELAEALRVRMRAASVSVPSREQLENESWADRLRRVRRAAVVVAVLEDDDAAYAMFAAKEVPIVLLDVGAPPPYPSKAYNSSEYRVPSYWDDLPGRPSVRVDVPLQSCRLESGCKLPQAQVLAAVDALLQHVRL